MRRAKRTNKKSKRISAPVSSRQRTRDSRKNRKSAKELRRSLHESKVTVRLSSILTVISNRASSNCRKRRCISKIRRREKNSKRRENSVSIFAPMNEWRIWKTTYIIIRRSKTKRRRRKRKYRRRKTLTSFYSISAMQPQITTVGRVCPSSIISFKRIWKRESKPPVFWVFSFSRFPAMKKIFCDKRTLKSCKIYNMLRAHAKKKHVSFHTPGHKAGDWDITELSYS